MTLDDLEHGSKVIAHNSAGMAEAADFYLRIPDLTATNFEALLPTDFKFLVSNDLNLFESASKF